jgi:hypothetical protein
MASPFDPTMRVIGVFLLLFVLGADKPLQPPNNQPQPHQPQTAAEHEQRGSDKSPLVIKVVPGPGTEESAAEERHHRKEQLADARKLTNATIALTIITFGLAMFTAFLWWTTRKLAQDAKETATRQAEQTQLALKHAEDTAKRQLRAYVFLLETKIVLTTMDDPIRVDIVLRNSGQTPAHDVFVWFRNEWREFPLNGPLPLTEPSPEDRIAPLAPQAITSHRHFTTGALTEKMHSDMVEGRKAIYVHGGVRYTDVFGKRWTTRVRLLCTADDLRLKCLRIAQDGNEEIEG